MTKREREDHLREREREEHEEQGSMRGSWVNKRRPDGLQPKRSLLRGGIMAGCGRRGMKRRSGANGVKQVLQNHEP